VLLVLVLPFEDVALREELGRADEQPLFDEEVARFLLGDTDEVGHDITDQAELLMLLSHSPRMSTIRKA